MTPLSCTLALLLSAVQAAEVAARDSPRSRADVHFLAGFDHHRAGRAEDARREWKACREIDETHDFCDFGLSLLDSGASKPAAVSDGERQAGQAYLEGLIHYQKGDYEKARTAWNKAKELAPKGSDTASDAAAGLERIEKLYAPAGKRSRSPAEPLGKKDEHDALEAYYSGLIHYQNGDAAKARTEWDRALSLAPKGSAVESDAKAGLQKLDAGR